MDTTREAAYRSLIAPMPITDAARELGVTEDYLKEEIARKALGADGNSIRGSDLADYLVSKRVQPD